MPVRVVMNLLDAAQSEDVARRAELRRQIGKLGKRAQVVVSLPGWLD